MLSRLAGPQFAAQIGQARVWVNNSPRHPISSTERLAHCVVEWQHIQKGVCAVAKTIEIDTTVRGIALELSKLKKLVIKNLRRVGKLCPALLSCLVFFCVNGALAQTNIPSVFTSFTEAQPAFHALQASPAPQTPALGDLTVAAWPDWLQKHDREIRLRLTRGEEDTLTDFLRFGLSFTKQPPISNRELIEYDGNATIRATAEQRIDDLVSAMASPGSNERVAQSRAFVEAKGFAPQSSESKTNESKTSESRDKLKAYLLANLLRMRDEFLQYIHQPQGANPFEIFKDRGISLDTNLYPDFLIDVHLRHMIDAGLLKPGSIRRVAIVGPGLDFSNKEGGSDYYPPQTNQPFAVIDSLFRLGLSDSKILEVYTLDISPNVNSHIQEARMKAHAGIPYVLQLPWNTAAPVTEEYRGRFESYWQSLGDRIGESTAPFAVPAALADRTKIKAVKIRPEIVSRIRALDLDVVCQHLKLPDDQGFDLVIGTNVFLYYGLFDQLLIRSNVALMLKPGGFLLSNDKFPDTVPEILKNSLITSQTVGQSPEYMFSYQR
jgi:hypothetical protein